MDPFPERGIREVQRVGDGLEALALDDLAHGLGTAEDTGFLRLFEKGISGGEGFIRKVKFEGPHCGGLQKKVLQKFTAVRGPLTLLWEQSLFDSNFPGAAESGQYGVFYLPSSCIFVNNRMVDCIPVPVQLVRRVIPWCHNGSYPKWGLR